MLNTIAGIIYLLEAKIYFIIIIIAKENNTPGELGRHSTKTKGVAT